MAVCSPRYPGGGLSSKRSIDPILGFGREAEVQFAAAASFAKRGVLPYDTRAAAAYDLRYAAEYTVAHRRDLQAQRQRVAALVQELAERCRTLTAVLAKWRPPTVQAVAQSIHVGLIAVLVLVLRWPDWRLPMRFITGFATTGMLERSGNYDPVDSGAPGGHAPESSRPPPAAQERPT